MWTDLVRYGLLSQAGLTIGLSLAIFVMHLQAARHVPAKNRLLVWHILAISLAHAGAVLYMVEGTIHHLHEPFHLRVALGVVSMLLSDVALMLILRFQRRRGGAVRSTTNH